MSNVLEDSIQYIQDADVDEVLDEKLRSILSECFSNEPKFKTQRFHNELPKHRWYIEADGMIAAHLATHEKEFEIDGVKNRFIGIAEVCVRPEYRGRYLVKLLLSKAESFDPDIRYSILMGNPIYYSSSGYKKANNVYFCDISDKPDESIMVKCLKNDPWPQGKVLIKGLPF